MLLRTFRLLQLWWSARDHQTRWSVHRCSSLVYVVHVQDGSHPLRCMQATHQKASTLAVDTLYKVEHRSAHRSRAKHGQHTLTAPSLWRAQRLCLHE